jgi:hypothetical protein
MLHETAIIQRSQHEFFKIIKFKKEIIHSCKCSVYWKPLTDEYKHCNVIQEAIL